MASLLIPAIDKYMTILVEQDFFVYVNLYALKLPHIEMYYYNIF